MSEIEDSKCKSTVEYRLEISSAGEVLYEKIIEIDQREDDVLFEIEIEGEKKRNE